MRIFTIAQLAKAVKTKAVLIGMLEKCLKALAMTRRDRLDRDQLAQFADNLETRFKQLLAEEAIKS